MSPSEGEVDITDGGVESIKFPVVKLEVKSPLSPISFFIEIVYFVNSLKLLSGVNVKKLSLIDIFPGCKILLSSIIEKFVSSIALNVLLNPINTFVFR